VKHSSEVVSPTPFESTCGRRFSIRRTQNLRDEYIDHGMGGIAEPYVKNHIRRHTSGFDVADYDFVICIPHSSYRKDMRY
jgi:hypothetical protein